MMPETKTFKKNKKIKKVIIGEGITSISASAFEGCKNLKQVKLPKSIKRIGCKAFYNTNIKNLFIPENIEVIGEGAFNTIGYITKIKMPGHGYSIEPSRELNPLVYLNEDSPFEMTITFKAKTIVFTNSLPVLMNALTTMDTTNFVVSKGDPEYSSKDGVIYTKDFSRTVRLPNRKKIKICEGCKIFEMSSFYYSYAENLDGSMHYDYYCRIAHLKTRKTKVLILPKSLEYITDRSGYERQESEWCYYEQPLEKVIIKSNKLSKDSIRCLKDEFKDHPPKKGKVKIVYQY